ncbi:hypothetical protein FG379_001564 [Cryptosporidium bovis]|uniref:uncharacterized protein n=1 Tax=Cryptosporidium bovis TaxID=310047 RepID=UPI003519F1C4|nr:hypothetical protein FG379_001564 [Cryptosporidium bovis]
MMGANQDALMSEMSVMRQKIAQLEQENHELRGNYQSLLNSSNKDNETSNPITILVPGRPPENVTSEGGNVVASAEIRDPQHVSNIVVCSRRPIFSSECGGMLLKLGKWYLITGIIIFLLFLILSVVLFVVFNRSSLL